MSAYHRHLARTRLLQWAKRTGRRRMRAFPGALFFNLGAEITRLQAAPDALLAFTANGVYRLTYDGAGNFTSEPVP